MLETAQPKPRPRKRVQASNRRMEAKIKRQVRAACVERDGRCRLNTESEVSITALWALVKTGGCERSLSEWAHMEGYRRFETRGKPPEDRHCTHGSLMLCRKHHDMYDNRYPSGERLAITALSERGADGPLRFERVS